MISARPITTTETTRTVPPWPTLLTAARLWTRYGPGTRIATTLLPWLDAGLRQRPRTGVTRTRFGARMHYDTSDFVPRMLYMTGAWEPAITAYLTTTLRPGDTVIDLGAHHGYHTLLAATLVGPTGCVVAVEPAPATHHQLLANLARNHCRHVHTVRAAITENPCTVTLYTPDTSNTGNTTVLEPNPHTPAVTTTAPGRPLIDLLPAGTLEHARILKIDIEGAEATALTDLTGHLHRLAPDCELIVEISPDRLTGTGTTADEILQPFRNTGFHIYRLANSYRPHTYPTEIRSPTTPSPLTTPITGMTDLLLSRCPPNTDPA
ncbi:FkbM family methyltransferase [Nocardia sp. alder85J]|uniref:FkbM family methyltransferase n=1 Tax=Nocardia sp. alder85J TaxID=2862949 RepID=UPI001CD1A8CB|nr:FkbM family methyltransferase [Nocardia sp. alder85J]MCX4097759.1 FkbM family methyltransferase [Nocardia sp. alder85J]